MDWGELECTQFQHTDLGGTHPFVEKNESEYMSHTGVVVFDLMTSMMQSIVFKVCNMD